MKSVDNAFSPELINRIDETIVFHSLSEDDIFKIIDLQLKDLKENLEKIGLKIKVSASAKRLLARKGINLNMGQGLCAEKFKLPLRITYQRCY